MANGINKKAAYIFPELGNVILTNEDLFAGFDTKPTPAEMRLWTKDQVYDFWMSETVETSRYHICDECNKIHSRTYESCDTEASEFNKFFKSPTTIYLDCI